MLDVARVLSRTAVDRMTGQGNAIGRCPGGQGLVQEVDR